MFDAPSHWLVVAVVALVLFFGWKQLPDMARSVGRSLRIFKTEMKGMTQDEKERAEAAEKTAREAEPPRALPPAQVVRNEGAPRAAAESGLGASAAGAPARPRPRPAPGAEAPDQRADAS